MSGDNGRIQTNLWEKTQIMWNYWKNFCFKNAEFPAVTLVFWNNTTNDGFVGVTTYFINTFEDWAQKLFKK